MVTNTTVPKTGQGPRKIAGANAFGAISVRVHDGANPVRTGGVSLYRVLGGTCDDVDFAKWSEQAQGWTPIDNNNYRLENGGYEFTGLTPGLYIVSLDHVVLNDKGKQNPAGRLRCVEVEPNCKAEVCFDFGIDAVVTITTIDEDCQPRTCQPRPGDTVRADLSGKLYPHSHSYSPAEGFVATGVDFQSEMSVLAAGAYQGVGTLGIASTIPGAQPAELRLSHDFRAAPRLANQVGGSLTVSHKRRIAEPDGTMSFFVRLLDASRSIEFGRYADFIDSVFECPGSEKLSQSKCLTDQVGLNSKLKRLQTELTDHGVGAYELLKTATEAFLLFRCCAQAIPVSRDGSADNSEWVLNYNTNPQLGDYKGYSSDNWRKYFGDYLKGQLGSTRLPYIQRVIDTAFPQYGITAPFLDQRFCADVLLRSRVENPCFLELIWNYWHEESMLVQSMNAVSRRFQNLRAPGRRDPLAHMEIDPLRPLNNILWGYVEDERGRLSIKRRGYEYQHQYGLNLYGKAVADLRPADSRSKFIEAFHNLLNRCADYYRAKQDTTVDPDGYPILHAIQELNLILAQGAHNQFGDLAWTSRVEMLMQQWIVARPEMRDFLQSRAMVPYKEAWMPQVDTMKTMQGWSDVVVTHFRDLGVFGEQILLTIRWYNWYDVTSEEEAKGWADLLRAQIQTYIHAYRAVTGVDLSSMDRVDYTMPSLHLRKRLAMQQRAR